MTNLKQAAQQALEALESGDWYIDQLEMLVYSADDTGTHEERAKVQAAITALRAALAQQADTTDPGHDVDVLREHVRHLERRIRELHAQQAEPLNLSDRAVQRRLAAQWGYVPAAAQAEPVEPVAWECKAGGLKPLTQRQYDAQTAATKRHYTRIAPPQHEALQNTKHYEAPPGFVLNPDYLVPELRAQRDALLEALKVAEPYLRHADVDYNVYVQCRAAIALVEGRVKAVEEGK